MGSGPVLGSFYEGSFDVGSILASPDCLETPKHQHHAMPNIRLVRTLWSLVNGLWGSFKGSCWGAGTGYAEDVGSDSNTA